MLCCIVNFVGLGVGGGDFGGLSKPTMVQLWRRGNRVKPLVLIGLNYGSEPRHNFRFIKA